jgi:Chaperone of endosialidase
VGSVTGLQDSLNIKATAASVTSLQGTVGAKADSNTVNTKLNALQVVVNGKADTTMLKKKADTTWVLGKIGAMGGGTITGVTADSGLTGGGTSGSVSLKVKYGGNGTAATVARSDHTHTGLTDANVSAGANIAGSKVNPDFGSQNIATNGYYILRDASTNVSRWALNTTTNIFALSRWDATGRVNECLQIQSTGTGANQNYFALMGAAEVDGSLQCVSLTQTSDRRFKKLIVPIDSALDKIISLQGVSYYWDVDNFPDRNFSTTRQIGLIAQDVEKVVPEVVHTNDDGYKSLSYDKLTAVLIEAVKRQQLMIESQGKRIADLEQKIAESNQK